MSQNQAGKDQNTVFQTVFLILEKTVWNDRTRGFWNDRTRGFGFTWL